MKKQTKKNTNKCSILNGVHNCWRKLPPFRRTILVFLLSRRHVSWPEKATLLTYENEKKNSFFSFKNILGNLEDLYSGDTIIFLQTLASLQWHVKVPLEQREADSSLFIRKRSRNHNYDWLSQQNEWYEQTGKEMKEKY